MDEDVKLSMQQAHEKWTIKMIVFGGSIVLAAFAFSVHDCNRYVSQKPCSEATIDPKHKTEIQCPDPRQTLSYPPGWTWAKCSCPETPEK